MRLINSNKDLKILVKDSQTPKGLNEQGLNEMIKKDVYKSVASTLDGIYKRLNK
jgi:pyrroline-5-carboxylate reductase